MLFIGSKVSIAMKEQQSDELMKTLGKAISIIPRKSKEWLMIEFANRCDLSFRGNRKQPAAFIEVKKYRKSFLIS